MITNTIKYTKGSNKLISMQTNH